MKTGENLQIYMYLDTYTKESAEEAARKLIREGYRPKLKEVVGGDLDGQFDVNLPLTDYVLYMQKDRPFEFKNKPLGVVMESLCDEQLDYAEYYELSNHKIQKYHENMETILTNKTPLNNNTISSIKRIQSIERAFYSDINNFEKNEEDKKMSPNNFNEQSFVFAPEKQKEALGKKYKLEEVENKNVLLFVDKNDLETLDRIQDCRNSGYSPIRIAVPKRVNVDLMKIESYVSVPFYAFADWAQKEHFANRPESKDMPLGDALIKTCKDLTNEYSDNVLDRHYEVLQKAISDNLEHFNKHKLKDAGELFNKWQQNRKDRSR